MGRRVVTLLQIWYLIYTALDPLDQQSETGFFEKKSVAENVMPQQYSLTQITGIRILLSPLPLAADFLALPLALLNLPAGLST